MIQVLSAAPSVSVEKSFDFSTDFHVFGGIFARFEKGKDLEREITLDKVFIFAKKLTTLFILHGSKKSRKKYQLIGLE